MQVSALLRADSMTAFFQSTHSLLRLMKLDMINYEIGLAKPHMQQVVALITYSFAAYICVACC